MKRELYRPPLVFVKLKNVNLIARVLVPGEPMVTDVVEVDRFYVYSGPAAPYPTQPTAKEFLQAMEDAWLEFHMILANSRKVD